MVDVVVSVLLTGPGSLACLSQGLPLYGLQFLLEPFTTTVNLHYSSSGGLKRCVIYRLNPVLARLRLIERQPGQP